MQQHPNTTGNYPRSAHPSAPPPLKASGPSKAPLGLSAGGGLIAGFLVGFFLLAGSGEDKEAVASNDTTEESAAPASTYGEGLEEAGDKAEERGDVAPDLGGPEAGADESGEGAEAVAETNTADSDTDEPNSDEGEGERADEGSEESKPEPSAEPEPVLLSAAISFEVKPADIQGLSITVDDEEQGVDGFSLEYLEGSKKKITVRAKAAGYRDFKKVVRVDGDTTVNINMRQAGSSTGGKKKKKKGPGGLISL